MYLFFLDDQSVLLFFSCTSYTDESWSADTTSMVLYIHTHAENLTRCRGINRKVLDSTRFIQTPDSPCGMSVFHSQMTVVNLLYT